ncbi:MAG: DUF2306 domain-containing protein [Pseudomonadota bacterium]
MSATIRLSWLAIMLGSLGVAGYALVGYLVVPLGDLVHPEMKAAFETYRVGIYSHIFASLVALAIGPFQFVPWIRQRYLNVHRWSGRAYLTCIGIGGLSGFYVAQFAFGGVVSIVGFSMLALLWLLTGWQAFTAIRRGDISRHREWMIRSFALTLAAVTLRIQLGLYAATGNDFEVFYPLLAWTSWVPNMILAEWYIHHGRSNEMTRAE